MACFDCTNEGQTFRPPGLEFGEKEITAKTVKPSSKSKKKQSPRKQIPSDKLPKKSDHNPMLTSFKKKINSKDIKPQKNRKQQQNNVYMCIYIYT